MRVAVIGGSGFIGMPLIESLKRNHAVAVVHRTHKQLEGVTQIITDINKGSGFWIGIQQFKPDVIVHQILSDANQAKELISHCKDLKCRVIVLSSADVYTAFAKFIYKDEGAIEPTPLKENAPCHALNFAQGAKDLLPAKNLPEWVTHDYNKKDVEDVLMSQNSVQCTIFRPSFIYGCNDDNNRLGYFIKSMSDQRPTIILNKGLANWKSSFIYVDNVVQAITWSVEKEFSSNVLFNLGSESRSMLTIIESLAKAVCWKGQIGLSHDYETSRCNYSQDFDLDITELRTAGFNEKISLEDGLKETYEWGKTTSIINFYAHEDKFIRDNPDSIEWQNIA
ncbi:MAG: NAD-dependent epimerase/dehydratase family protein [Parachlamydiales bacterium]|nr:NAD-dependent epimerase/dehydratase family protein [Parachlamydiales bacterium]